MLEREPRRRFDTLDQRCENPALWYADVAQLVEQPIRNRQVIGSSPIVGSIPVALFAYSR
jgi:hypothetical protein